MYYLFAVIHNALMLAEMVVLQYAARKLYKRVLPTDYTTDTITRISTIGGIMATNLFQDNNNSHCENLNNLFTINRSKIGHVNVALDIRE